MIFSMLHHGRVVSFVLQTGARKLSTGLTVRKSLVHTFVCEGAIDNWYRYVFGNDSIADYVRIQQCSIDHRGCFVLPLPASVLQGQFILLGRQDGVSSMGLSRDRDKTTR